MVWQIPDAVDTVVCAPDDGWRYHPKHVEQFPDIINCVMLHLFWIYIGIHHHELCQLQNTVISAYNETLWGKQKFWKSKTYWALTAHVSGVWHYVIGQVLRSFSKHHDAFIGKVQASQEKRLQVTFTLQVNLVDHGYVLAHTYTCHTCLFE
jgi:hypothetical protein